MSYGYADLRRRITESHGEVDQPKQEVPGERGVVAEVLSAVSEPATTTTSTSTTASKPATPASKRPRGTSPFPQVKISREAYDALKVVASLSGKTVQQMLERFVLEGVDGFRNLTVDQILSR